MIKRILILLLITFIVSSCGKERFPNSTGYYSYINAENDLGLYAKISFSRFEFGNLLFSIQRDERYYDDSCILVPNFDEVDSICTPALDLNSVEFRLIYRPTNPKEDDILLTIGDEFFSDEYLLDEDKIFSYTKMHNILGYVIYSIPFYRPGDQSLSYLEDFEFVVVIDQTEYLLFRGITVPI